MLVESSWALVKRPLTRTTAISERATANGTERSLFAIVGPVRGLLMAGWFRADRSLLQQYTIFLTWGGHLRHLRQSNLPLEKFFACFSHSAGQRRPILDICSENICHHVASEFRHQAVQRHWRVTLLIRQP